MLPSTQLLVNAGGIPTPPSDTVRRLKERDPRLGCQFIECSAGWGITLRWREDDTRRQMIREGKHPPDEDYDILSILPIWVRGDEIEGYLDNVIRRTPLANEQGLMTRDALREENARVSEEAFKPVFEAFMNEVEVLVGNRVQPNSHVPNTRETKPKDPHILHDLA